MATTVDLDAVESRYAALLTTAQTIEALGIQGLSVATGARALEKVGLAAAASAKDVPALVAEIRDLRARLGAVTR